MATRVDYVNTGLHIPRLVWRVWTAITMFDTNAALIAIVSALQARDPNVQAMINKFLRQFDPEQLQQDGVQRLRTVLDFTSTTFAREFALELLISARRRYPADCLTPVHGFAARQCCFAQRYDIGLWLDQYSIDRMPREYHLLAEDHMVYNYFIAICHLASGDYDRAMSLLRLVLQTGGEASSVVQVEAYQKYILIGLMRDGRANPPPDMSQALSRSLQHIATAYDELADACQRTVRSTFKANSISRAVARPRTQIVQTDAQGPVADTTMEGDRPAASAAVHDATTASSSTSLIDDVVAKYRQAFGNDNNLHLIENVRALLPLHRAREASRVYTSLPLATFAERCGLGSAEEASAFLATAVSSGLLRATVTTDGFVSFDEVSDTATPAKSPPVDLAQLKALQERMLKLQRALELERASKTTTSAAPASQIEPFPAGGRRFSHSQTGVISPAR